jgi:DNA polymerase-3 subunit delta
MPSTTHLIFRDGLINKSNSLLTTLSPISETYSLESPTRDTLSRWIKDRAQSKGSNINPAAIRLLSDLIGNDLWTLDSELEKLSLYAYTESIGEHHVTALVSQVKEANIFNAVDSIINKKPSPALKFLKQLQKDGNDSSYIITMIARQVRLIALSRDLLDQGTSQNDIGNKLGINSQFVLKKTLDQASCYSDSQIRSCYANLLKSDLSIKQGLMASDFALELLTYELSTN